MPNEEDVLVYCSDTKEQMVGFHKGKGLFQFFYMNGVEWICPYISRHLLSLNPLLACCRRYSRGER
ncbi:hypothetical protein MZP11_27365 [Escherichia coli]